MEMDARSAVTEQLAQAKGHVRSPHVAPLISPHLPSSASWPRRFSSDLPSSPLIYPHLPSSPLISPHLPSSPQIAELRVEKELLEARLQARLIEMD